MARSGTLLASRILIGGGVLLWTAFATLFAWSSVELFMATYGFDLQSPLLAAVGVGSFIIGALIVLGWWCRTAAAIAFCLALPLLFFRLSFWGLPGFQATVAQTLFTTTAALMGGLMLLTVRGPGRFAIPSKENNWADSPEFRSWGLILGRLLIGGGFFLWNGIWKFVDWQFNIEILQAWRIPAPQTILWVMALIEIVGGLLLIIGWRPRVMSWILIAYVALVALFLHHFWTIPSPQGLVIAADSTIALFVRNVYVLDRTLQAKLFADSLGIIGSLLLVTAQEKRS